MTTAQQLPQMKNHLERHGNRRVVRINFHNICHVVPPFLHYRVIAEIDGRVFLFEFLNSEQDIGFFVKENAIIAYPVLLEQLPQFGPNFGMAFPVLFLETGVQLHFKGDDLHSTNIGSIFQPCAPAVPYREIMLNYKIRGPLKVK